MGLACCLVDIRSLDDWSYSSGYCTFEIDVATWDRWCFSCDRVSLVSLFFCFGTGDKDPFLLCGTMVEYDMPGVESYGTDVFVRKNTCTSVHHY